MPFDAGSRALVPAIPAADPTRLSQEWFTPAELARLDLPELASTERSVQRIAGRQGWQRPETEGQHWRGRQARGGGVEYHWTVLPEAARMALAPRFLIARPAAETVVDPDREARAREYDGLPAHKKRKAEQAVAALDTIQRLVQGGSSRLSAIEHTARLCEVSRATIYNWQKTVAGLPREDWRYWLAPRQSGNGRDETPMHPDAWRALCGLYLRVEQPSFADCWRLLKIMAAEQGWGLPSARTAQRRLDLLSPLLVTALREGTEAHNRALPAQRRDVRGLRALEVVNADGHIWDVFVRWEDGTVGRPVMIAFQDIRSRKALSWRLDRSENKEAVRLAFGDLVERYGIPEAALFDNGRHFASKWLTGGAENRYRFKIRDDEPEGILVQLGVAVHFTNPYSGQSKPIERLFGSWAHTVAKDPRFAGAYVGNSPDAKPENYGSRAVPIEEFRAVLEQHVGWFNAEPGRRGAWAEGRSYDQVFEESYTANAARIRRATAEQRRLWLMAAEAVTVRPDSTVHLLGNRYHAEFLVRMRGQKVTIRFDPDNLHTVPAHIYRTDGVYLGEAPCIADVGFLDKTAAQETARARKAALNHTRRAAEAMRRMPLHEQGRLIPALDKAEAPALPEQRVVRPVFGATALKAVPIADDEADEAEAMMLRGLAQARGERPGLRLIEGSDEDV